MTDDSSPPAQGGVSETPADVVIRALQARELAPQLSDEWFRIRREEIFSATDVGALLGMDKYKSREKVLAVKGGMQADSFTGNQFTEHGRTFEDVIRAIHEWMCGEPIDSLGLLRHPTLSFLGASPDGIGSRTLRLKEFKCPMRRGIERGQCPPGYWAQIQLQLNVCELSEADYVEAHLISNRLYSAPLAADLPRKPWPAPVFSTAEPVVWSRPEASVTSCSPFLRATTSAADDDDAAADVFYGYIAKYEQTTVYPEMDGTVLGQDPRCGIDSIMEQLTRRGVDSSQVTWFRWECETYHSMPVTRDDVWWIKSVPILEESWQEVLRRRRDRTTTSDSSSTDSSHRVAKKPRTRTIRLTAESAAPPLSTSPFLPPPSVNE